MCVQIVFKLVEVYSCFTEKAHSPAQQRKRSVSPLLHPQLSGLTTILPFPPLSPFSRLCPLASFLLAAGQLGSGPPWLGSGVASAGQEGGGEVRRGGGGGGGRGGGGTTRILSHRRPKRESVRKIGNKHVRSRKVKKKKEKKKKRQQLCPSPLSLSTPPPSSLFPSFSLTLSLLGEAWPGLA